MIEWARTNAGFKERREPFVYQGVAYSLAHLNALTLQVSGGVEKYWNVFVIFQDHCFTRSMDPSDDRALLYSMTATGTRSFCFDRYQLSLRLVDYLKDAVNGTVWMASDDNFMVVKIVGDAGSERYYGIFFSIARSKDPAFHIRIWVQTAYPFEGKPPPDFGKVRFKHLLQRMMEGKTIKRIYGSRRKWPDL